MDRHSTGIASVTPSPTETFPKKRKRDESLSGDIEVDVRAPEPPSKKTLRRAKKEKALPGNLGDDDGSGVRRSVEEAKKEDFEEHIQSVRRSEFGIWIGNLPWTATKADLRCFLTQNTDILEVSITRLHMPVPSKTSHAMPQQKLKPQNKGFAYVDFSTQAALDKALTLSEKLFTGRRVLIKDSKSFEGRPEPAKADAVTTHSVSAKAPSKRVFVGNLTFETTKEQLAEHFKQCGDVESLQIATFEDSGKCKGYAWVDFAELESAETAVRGWICRDQENDSEDDDGELPTVDIDETQIKKKAKPRKWWVNKLHGRLLRTEFAEDKGVRYKKRFGKDSRAQKNETAVVSQASGEASGLTLSVREDRSAKSKDRKPLEKVDARNIKPGAALAAAPRSSGAIVEAQGKKIVF
ncbi:MAG: hypothetical protein Q9164_001245 [Protoblastenia rupestris]